MGKLTIADGWSVALRRLGFDPLVAQAIVERLVLVSADPRLGAYGVAVLT